MLAANEAPAENDKPALDNMMMARDFGLMWVMSVTLTGRATVAAAQQLKCD